MRSSAMARRLTGAALLVASVFGATIEGASTPVAHAAASVEVAAWIPEFQINDGLASFTAHSGSMGELDAFFYESIGAGTVGYNSSMTTARRALLPSYRSAATAAGVPLIATIADGMAPGGMAAVIADPTTRAQHVQALVDFAAAGGFDGVDIDYESFAFFDGKASWPATFDAWGAFVGQLGTALHDRGLRFEVSVPPIYNALHDNNTSGYWVYNYPLMAQSADRVKVLAYNFSVQTAGPNAPYNWVASVLGATLQIVPAGRLVLGIPAFGSDWPSTTGACPLDPGTGLTIAPIKRTVRTVNAAKLAADKGQVPTWDATRRERTFSYTDTFSGVDINGMAATCVVQHTVWYPDADAIFQRVALAQSKGLVGVALFAAGYEDAATWNGIAAARAGQPFTSDLPARFLDTRPAAQYPTADGQFSGLGTRPADSTLTLQIAGRGAVPATATAVTLNVTVLGQAEGFVTVYPCGDRPNTSSLNVRAGQTIANSVITRLSATGAVCIYTQQAADVIVDVFNVVPGATITTLPSPARLLDTRAGQPTIDGQHTGEGALGINGVLEVPVAGRGGMAADARVAVLNVTAVGAAGQGFLTIWPCDAPRPATSNVNDAPGAAVPNAVITALSSTGTVCVFSSNVTDVVVDVFAALAPSAYASLAQAARLMDTRAGGPTIDGQLSGIGTRQINQVTTVQITGRGGIPDHPPSVVLNVTATDAVLPGYLTVYPCDAPRPTASNVNVVPGQTAPNLVVSRLSAAGTVCVFTSSPTEVIVDAFGTLAL